MDRVAVVEAALDHAIDAAPQGDPVLPDAPLAAGSSLTARRARELFEDQVTSRTLDVVARELRAAGTGYYTISSAGHEDDVVLGALLRLTDPGFLHYRSGAFMVARSRQHGATDAVRDTLLSVMAARDDPIAQGRHKVWGSRALWIPPQTSTIASHLPKAVGMAVALGRRRHLPSRTGPAAELPNDAIVLASFGDASLNHASALTAINAARWARVQGSPVPLLLVCEDNGIGISTPTPSGWVADTISGMDGVTYLHATGSLDEVWGVAERAVTTCRARRVPVFLHLDTVRLWGHAGSDVESGYRSRDEIAADEARDPLARTARQLVTSGAATREELRATVHAIRTHVREVARDLSGAPHLHHRDEVVAPLAPHRRDAVVRDIVTAVATADDRAAVHPRRLPELATNPAERTLAAHLNAVLRDVLAARPEAVLFGQDVARKGGVYGVTAGLAATFGARRVFDTLLDETSILGLAQGAALAGLLPIPEIGYLAYLHNALDQLRGEAGSTAFFSSGAFTTPMVVRVPGLAYQKGFGGHFHNDNAIGALRDIPGIRIVVPARGDDAARMVRGAVAMAAVDGNVVVLLEPIALYHERDLHTPGDGGWLTDHPPQGETWLPGQVRVYHPDAADVLVVTFGNGTRLSLRAARRLAERGIGARVLDLGWLAPLPFEAIAHNAAACGAVLVADECRATGGGVADAVIASLAEARVGSRLASVRSTDSYVPLGPAADVVLLSEDDIVQAALELAR